MKRLYSHFRIILLFYWTAFFLQVKSEENHCQLVKSGSESQILKHGKYFIHINFVPKAMNKLKFAEHHKVSKIVSCMSMCCKKSNCNAIMWVRKRCYILDCSREPDLCVMKPKSPKDKHSPLMALLKPIANKTDSSNVAPKESPAPEDTKDSSEFEKEFPKNAAPKQPHSRTCTFGIPKTCWRNEECVTKHELSKDGICMCQSGFVLNKEGGWCVPDSGEQTEEDSANTKESDSPHYDNFPCDDEEDCSSDEECVSKNSSPDDNEGMMFCLCRQGFVRVTEQGGQCVRNDIIVKPSTMLSTTVMDNVIVTNPTTSSLPKSTNPPPTSSSEPENGNQPPISDAGPNQSLSIYADQIILNGSGSTDDKKVVSYDWHLLHGPNEVKIENSTNPIAVVKPKRKFMFGKYTFQLKVKDKQGFSGASIVFIFFSKSPIIANAGPDQTVQLPVSIVILDGHRSVGMNNESGVIAEYKWTREADSIAAGRVVNNFTNQPTLLLTDVVEGDYHWLLTVKDHAGMSATDSVIIHVKPEPHTNQLLEIQLERPIQNFTESDKLNVIKQMEFILHKSPSLSNAKILVDRVKRDYATDNVVILFYVKSPTDEPYNGTNVIEKFKPKLLASKGVVEYEVLYLDTYFCQNPCSGNGYCDQFTKTCVCTKPWSVNFLRVYFGDGKSNCDIHKNKLIAFLSLGAVGFIVVLISLCAIFRRVCRKGSRKYRDTVVYTPLNDLDEMNIMTLETKKRKLKKKTPIRDDFSTDEENTLYRSPQVANGKTEPVS